MKAGRLSAKVCQALRKFQSDLSERIREIDREALELLRELKALDATFEDGEGI